MARQQRQNLEVVAESIAHIVWLSAPDGSTEYFNTVGTEYTGLPRDANYGWSWVEIVHEEDAARARAAWEEATRTVTAYQAEYRIRRHDGAYRWHSLRALPVRGRRGRVVGWFGTAVDIHDARGAAKRLRAIERQAAHVQALFAAAVSGAGPGQGETARRAIRVDGPRGEDDEGAAARHDSGERAEIDLSPGEADVVRLVALGHTNREVAELIGVSLRTVEARRGRAMRKLGATSRAELVRRAFESGLVDRP
jgi:PAS domain S-box-containing protein